MGSGQQIVPRWRFREEKRLARVCEKTLAIDYSMRPLKKHKGVKLRFRGDINNLPFKQDMFHLGSANMVVEHLGNPVFAFEEIRGVLRPDGIFLFHTPNSLGYMAIVGGGIARAIKPILISFLERRKRDAIYRTYHKGNSSQKINILAKASGLEVIKIRMIVSFGHLVMIPPLQYWRLCG